MANIANEDLQINFSNISGPPDIIYVGDQGIDAVKIVPVKSTNVELSNKKACTTSITINWTAVNVCPHTSATYNFVNGVGSIVAGSLKVVADAQPVLLEGDTGTCSGSWTLKVSPFTPIVCNCNCSISDAGQSEVQGI